MHTDAKFKYLKYDTVASKITNMPLVIEIYYTFKKIKFILIFLFFFCIDNLIL